MAFSFVSAAYHFPSKWTTDQRQNAQFIIKTGMKVGAKAADMQKMLIKAGTGYRKTNMLADISRAKSIEQAKSPGAYQRAESWYNTLEKVREQTVGKTRAEAITFMEKWKFETWESIEEAELANKLEMEGGCPSPPC